MCQFCEQREMVDDMCEAIGAVLTGITSMSMVVVVGDDSEEPMAAVTQRSQHLCSMLELAGFTVHPHRGNFKPQHFITILFQTQPGSKPSHKPH